MGLGYHLQFAINLAPAVVAVTIANVGALLGVAHASSTSGRSVSLTRSIAPRRTS